VNALRTNAGRADRPRSRWSRMCARPGMARESERQCNNTPQLLEATMFPSRPLLLERYTRSCSFLQIPPSSTATPTTRHERSVFVSNPFRSGQFLQAYCTYVIDCPCKFQTPSDRGSSSKVATQALNQVKEDVSNPFRSGQFLQVNRSPATSRCPLSGFKPLPIGAVPLRPRKPSHLRGILWFQTPSDRGISSKPCTIRSTASWSRVSNPFRSGHFLQATRSSSTSVGSNVSNPFRSGHFLQASGL
jgi:hypothetical protein